jgi:hypothetical protein
MPSSSYREFANLIQIASNFSSSALQQYSRKAHAARALIEYQVSEDLADSPDQRWNTRVTATNLSLVMRLPDWTSSQSLQRSACRSDILFCVFIFVQNQDLGQASLLCILMYVS